MGKGRAPCCDKNKVKRGPWSPAEDLRLISFIHSHGHGNWRALPKQAGLLRCGKSCRLRWINYLRPDVKRGSFTPQEEETIINLHTSIGNKWSKIASHLPGRTDNEIKNVWNTYLKKRALKKAEGTSASASSSHSPSCSIVTSGGDPRNLFKGSHDQECTKINVQKENSEDSHFPYSTSYTSSSPRCNNSVGGNNNVAHCQPFEIPLEKADIDDFWNILDTLEKSQEPSNLFQHRENGDGEARFDTVLGENSEEYQHHQWLRNLELELGLVGESGGSDNMMSLQDQCSIFDTQYPVF